MSVELFNLDENDSSRAYEQIVMNRPSYEIMPTRTAARSTRSRLMKCVKMTFLLVIVVMIVLALGWVLFVKHTSFSTSFNSDNLVGMPKDSVKTDEQSCDGWIVYKDEKCFKIFDDTLKTFDEAVENCAQLESGASLPIIHSKEEQQFLTAQLFIISKKVEGFWIGAKYLSNGDKFRWNDETDFSYTNWNIVKDLKSRSNYCAQMQAEEEVAGKWISVPCEKKNAVVCQKMQTWSMARMQKTHLVTRKQLREALSALGEANRKIDDLERNLEEANTRNNKKSSDLERIFEEANHKTKSDLIPIGFIYAQVPNEKAPSEIWPWMNWTDVSTSYAGVFFRVTGAKAAEFGQVQQENYPQITQFTTFYDGAQVTLGSPGSSPNSITSIQRYDRYYMNGIAFNVTTGEVRPRNMAIRIWKRTA